MRTVHPRAEDIVAAARACIGTRFRPQGRLVGVGLDCVGVVIHAARAGGAEIADRADYDLKGEGVRMLDDALGLAGFRTVGRAERGDVLLFDPGGALRHLAVASGDANLIHAHAGLRRVVEGPRDEGWRLIGAWRMPGE